MSILYDFVSNVTTRKRLIVSTWLQMTSDEQVGGALVISPNQTKHHLLEVEKTEPTTFHARGNLQI